MSRFVAIDLAKLPAPDVVELLSFETILVALKADLVERDASLTALLESDPMVKLLEVVAYRELVLRQRVNDATRAVLLATARGTDLDNLAAFYGVERQLTDAGDAGAIPPVAPTYEDDSRLRRRAQLALEGFTTAGPVGAYTFHALSADPRVKDCSITSPEPGDVLVTVLSTESDGVPVAAILTAVTAALNAEEVRPLNDTVIVQAASIVGYAVSAILHLFPGPDGETVRLAAVAAAQAYVDDSHRLGRRVTLSGLYAALHQPGVERVELLLPVGDVETTAAQAPHCTDLTVSVANG